MATIYAEFLDVEPEEYRRATEVTYHGMVWGTRSALKRMAKRNRGTIVQVGSALAFRGIPLQAPYCGAKHACKGFTESVVTEIEHRGWDVHVTIVHLAAFNTTQFTWGRTKLPKQTQPVPPIYQPEVAADAIHWAAYHRRRQVYVGFPTALNVLGERVAPWFLDWYLAKTGYSSQMTKHPLNGGPSHDNLFEPVDGDEDRGAHGPFDDEAHAHSLQTTLSKHRRLAGSVAAGVGAATGAVLLRKR
jgi:short-subunit dehydrogenase